MILSALLCPVGKVPSKVFTAHTGMPSQTFGGSLPMRLTKSIDEVRVVRIFSDSCRESIKSGVDNTIVPAMMLARNMRREGLGDAIKTTIYGASIQLSPSESIHIRKLSDHNFDKLVTTLCTTINNGSHGRNDIRVIKNVENVEVVISFNNTLTRLDSPMLASLIIRIIRDLPWSFESLIAASPPSIHGWRHLDFSVQMNYRASVVDVFLKRHATSMDSNMLYMAMVIGSRITNGCATSNNGPINSILQEYLRSCRPFAMNYRKELADMYEKFPKLTKRNKYLYDQFVNVTS